MDSKLFSANIKEKMQLHPITLSFRQDHKHMEKPFLDDYFISSLSIVRFAIIFGILIYSVFGILDAYLIPEKKHIFWLLRYAFFCPLAIGIFLFSFTSLFKKMLQQTLLFLVIVAGAIIIIMTVIASPPVNFSYYAGVILVFMMGYTVIRLQFIWATIAGWLLVLLYEYAAIFLTDTPVPILINNNFFFIGANLIGMIACYSIEYNTRRDYFLKYLLEVERKKVRNAKEVLEEKVQERTSQLLQAQKMDSIGTLAGGVAHDFNNLLTVINGYSELAMKKLKKGKIQNLHETIEPILHAGEKAAGLTSQLLAFSRKQVFSPYIIDLNSVIMNMNKILLRLINEDININIKLADDLPKIKADKTQLEQILINLVVNAKDAVYAANHKKSKKNIIIETGIEHLDENYEQKHREITPGVFAYLTVKDNGIGMDNLTKQNMFEPFFTTKDKSKGTGLGLSTVYGIVKQNKGDISVISEPGKGTTLKIYWPVSNEIGNQLKDEKIETSDFSGNESILLVEDEDNVRTFTKKAIESYGYSVLTASNGRLALELIKKKNYKFDLIITDLIMPELNGRDLIKKVKKTVPNINVIYISGYTDNQILNNGMLENGVNFIQKPFSPTVLASHIRKTLDN